MPFVTPRRFAGISWQARTTPAAGVGNADVFWDGGKFVASASTTSTTAQSTDGVTWTSQSLPGSLTYRLYYGEKFVVLRDQGSGTASYYSTDGLTWSSMNLPITGTWYRPGYGNGAYAVPNYTGSAANQYIYSTDGITWSTKTSMPSSQKWIGMTYGDPGGTATWIAYPFGGTAAAYSTDALTWSASTLPANANWYGAAWGNGVFVAITSGSTSAASSTDGITWSLRTLPSASSWSRVAFGNGLFVTLGYNSANAAYSTDGTTWVAATMPSSRLWDGMAFGSGRWVGVAQSATGTAASTFAASSDPNRVASAQTTGVARAASW